MPRKGNIYHYLINALVFIILEAGALMLLNHSGTLQNIWIMKGVHAFTGTVWGGSESVKYYFSLKSENRRLVEENDRLTSELRHYKEILEKEQEQKHSFSSSSGRYRYIPASVVKMSHNRQHNYIIVNKGSEDGVRERAGVITPDGAVGIISAVSRHYSYAIAFTNPDMAISTRIGHEGAVGTMTWDGMSARGAILNEIPCHIQAEPGDTVFTSGFSVIFPPDIPLGTIVDKNLKNGATFEIKVSLFKDFREIRYVSIVCDSDFDEIDELERR